MSVSIIAPYDVSLAAGLEFYPSAGSPIVTRLTVGDEYWVNVKSLLRFNGSDGSTTITDTRGIHTWTAMGDAQLDTAQSKWGGSSLLLDGTGDYVKTENTLTDFDFGGGSWCIEGWFYLNETMGSNVRALFGYGGGFAGWNTTNGHVFIMFINTDGNTYFQYNSGGGAASKAWAHSSLSAGFHFVQVLNDATSNAFSVRIDGTVVSSSAKITISTITAPLRFTYGNIAALDMPWKGWIDDVRVTPGIVRSPTVPTAEFLNGYATNSPAATHKFNIPGNSIRDIAECLDLMENSLGGTGSLSYGYQLNGGSLVSGQTLAQLKAAVRNATITVHTDSLIVYVSHASDGLQQVESAIKLGGGLHVEDPTGGGNVYCLID